MKLIALHACMARIHALSSNTNLHEGPRVAINFYLFFKMYKKRARACTCIHASGHVNVFVCITNVSVLLNGLLRNARVVSINLNRC